VACLQDTLPPVGPWSILGACHEELARERVGSGGSIAKYLAHILSAQEGWFARLVDEERPPRPEAPESDIVATLRKRYDESHRRLAEYAARLTEEELARAIDIEWQGETFNYRVWKVLMHLANHGTQHRAEVGIALLSIGASPGDLDLDDFYFRDRL
jgi:uncharacterized damage-inducible protein DinB